MKSLIMILVCAIAVPAVASFDYAALEDDQSSSGSWELEATILEPTLPAKSQNTNGFGFSNSFRRDNDNTVSSEDIAVLKPGNGEANGFYKNGKAEITPPANGNWAKKPVGNSGNGDSAGAPSPTPLPSSITLSLVGAGCIGLLRKRKIL